MMTMTKNQNRIYKLFLLLLVLIIPLFTFPAQAFASNVVRFSSDMYIAEEDKAGSVVVFGGDVQNYGRIENGAIFGGSLISEGTIDGSIALFGGDAIIDGPVYGSLALFGGDAILGEEANITGDLVLFGGRIQQSPGAIVNNIQVFNSNSDITISGIPKGLAQIGLGSLSILTLWLRMISGVLLISFSWLLGVILPKQTEIIMEYIKTETLKSFGLGLLVKVLFVPVMFALLITLLGIPLIPVVWLTLWLLQLLGLAALGLLLGNSIMERIGKESLPSGLSLFVGLLVIVLVRQIPFAGWLTLFVLNSIGLGAVLFTKLGSK